MIYIHFENVTVDINIPNPVKMKCLPFKKGPHIIASVQQGRIIVTTLLQTWILLSATRSYHSYDLVADMDFAQCNKVVS